MNITQFSTPFSTSYNTTSTNWSIPTSISSSAGSSGSAVGSSNQSSPNPQLWNISAFGQLSGPLLLVTIIIPIIVGPTIRWLLQTYIRLRRFWRLVYVTLGLAVICLYYTPVPSLVSWLLCDVPLCFIAGLGFNARIRSKERLRYLAFLAFIMALSAVDFFTVTLFPFGLLGWATLLYFQRRGSTFILGLPNHFTGRILGLPGNLTQRRRDRA